MDAVITKSQKQDNQGNYAEINDEDTIDFIIENLSKPNSYSRIYLGIISILFLIVLIINFWHWSVGILDIRKIMLEISGGLLIGSSVIMMLHEWLQSLVYQRLGARNISFRFSLKRLSFIVRAIDHPVNLHQIKILIFLPFLLINALLLGLALMIPFWSDLILFTLLIHSLYCMRDFALLSYIHEQGALFTKDTANDTTLVYK